MLRKSDYSPLIDQLSQTQIDDQSLVKKQIPFSLFVQWF